MVFVNRETLLSSPAAKCKELVCKQAFAIFKKVHREVGSLPPPTVLRQGTPCSKPGAIDPWALLADLSRWWMMEVDALQGPAPNKSSSSSGAHLS